MMQYKHMYRRENIQKTVAHQQYDIWKNIQLFPVIAKDKLCLIFISISLHGYSFKIISVYSSEIKFSSSQWIKCQCSINIISIDKSSAQTKTLIWQPFIQIYHSTVYLHVIFTTERFTAVTSMLTCTLSLWWNCSQH